MYVYDKSFTKFPPQTHIIPLLVKMSETPSWNGLLAYSHGFNGLIGVKLLYAHGSFQAEV